MCTTLGYKESYINLRYTFAFRDRETDRCVRRRICTLHRLEHGACQFRPFPSPPSVPLSSLDFAIQMEDHYFSHDTRSSDFLDTLRYRRCLFVFIFTVLIPASSCGRTHTFFGPYWVLSWPLRNIMRPRISINLLLHPIFCLSPP